MNKKYIKIVLGALIGAVLGYSYYYFIGCNGSCAITSSPYISVIYGMIAGVAIVFPSKSKENKDEN